MKKRVFTLITPILFLLFTFNNFLSAQDKADSANKSKPEKAIMNQLDFGFSVPDSSIINRVDYVEEKGFAAFDKTGHQLFIIFPYDNGPDYISEGMFRIIENGLIGFASELGEIVIEPMFNAVLPFRNGLAAFCDGCILLTEGEHKRWDKGKWGFIDRNGDVVIQPIYDRIFKDFEDGYASVEKDGIDIKINRAGKQIRVNEMNYNEWVRLLGESVLLFNKAELDNEMTVNLQTVNCIDGFNFYQETSILQVELRSRKDEKILGRYYIIPWQNFHMESESRDLLLQIPLHEFFSVTEYAVIYMSYPASNLSTNENKLVGEFNEYLQIAIEFKNNIEPVEEEINIPENVQVISRSVFANFIDLQIAIPGSKMPAENAWEDVSTNKMLRLSLVPDIGPARTNWIKQRESFPDTYYSSVENELQSLFADAVRSAIENPSRRDDIFESTKAQIRSLFSASNSWVNYLYDKYKTRLKQWLVIREEKSLTQPEELFPDYSPKETPDTVIDFMPSLVGDLALIPQASTDNLSSLISLFNKHQKEAESNPGMWENGNLVLGAKEREYIPSKPELILCEIGERIQSIINSQTKDQINSILQTEDITIPADEYFKFTFVHLDVMGSGRFFYVDRIEKCKLMF